MAKKTIVFLHGWGSEPEVWHKQIEYFKKTYKVTAPDVYSFKDVPGREKFILIGWSLGGMVALDYARRNPERLDGLVLISSTPRFVRSEGAKFGTSKAFLKKMERRVCADRSEALEWFRRLAAIIHEPVRKEHTEPAVLCEWLNWLDRMDLRPALAEIKAPCLIIHSDDDEIVSVEAARYLKKNLPNSSMHILKGAGHAPFLTEAEKVNALIEGFIRENKGE